MRSAAQRRSNAAQSAASLDSETYLGTSVQEWLHDTETAGDKRKQLEHYQHILTQTMLQIAHKHDAEGIGKENPLNDGAKKRRRQRWDPTRDAYKLSNCQTEWIGFRASCCGGAGIAVPIGCGHRLCFLCNGYRSEKYRDRVRVLFDRLTHPQFLTLTVPSVAAISKRTIGRIRESFKTFLRANKAWMQGGIYSIEITYNRQKKLWHPHIHCLYDAPGHLPKSRVNFVRFKKRLEFEWLLLTGGKKNGWNQSDFVYWLASTAHHRAGDPWNVVNRRVVDVRPVRDRKKAAYEVLKYITKSSAFADLPQAIEQLLPAVRGVRMLQTFGSWYGFKLDDDAAPANAWRKLKCACGENHWENLGRIYREGVELTRDGKWIVKEDFALLRCRSGGKAAA